MRRSTWRLYAFFQVLFILSILGCDEEDVPKASGEYNVTVTDPEGVEGEGRATVENSGDFFYIVIESTVENFGVTGVMAANVIETTFTDSTGSEAKAIFLFASDLGSFTGSIQTTTGLFAIRGTRR